MTRNRRSIGALLLALVTGAMAFSDSASVVQLVAAAMNLIALSLMAVWLWMCMEGNAPE